MKSETFSEVKYSDPKWYSLSKPEDVRIKKALRLIGDKKKVLDVGAYNGKISKKIKELGNDVCAVDAADAFANDFSESGIEFVKSDVEKKIPYGNNSFDVVFAGELIEHLVDTDGLLGEIRRILKKDGFLVITTPNAASLARRLLLLLGKNPFFEASYSFPNGPTAGHLRYFTFGLLHDFLEFHGFEVVEEVSDVVNFSSKISSEFLAEVFPTFGRSIIIKATLRK